MKENDNVVQNAGEELETGAAEIFDAPDAASIVGYSALTGNSHRSVQSTSPGPNPRKLHLRDFLAAKATEYENMWIANAPPTAPAN